MSNGFLDGVGLPRPERRKSSLEEAIESPDMPDDDVLDIGDLNKRDTFQTPWVPIPEDDPFEQWEYFDLD